MKKFLVETRFVFNGTFEVIAETKEDAIKIVENNCGLVMGGNIHTSSSDEIVTDWNFDTHTKKEIVSIM